MKILNKIVVSPTAPNVGDCLWIDDNRVLRYRARGKWQIVKSEEFIPEPDPDPEPTPEPSDDYYYYNANTKMMIDITQFNWSNFNGDDGLGYGTMAGTNTIFIYPYLGGMAVGPGLSYRCDLIFYNTITKKAITNVNVMGNEVNFDNYSCYKITGDPVDYDSLFT